MKIRVYLALSLSAFFWGGSAIAGKYALAVFVPSLVTFLRFFIAAIIILWCVKDKRQLIQIDLLTHLRMFITAIFGVTLCYYFYFNGLNSSTAFNAGIIEATIPLITLLIAAMSGMEHVNPWQLAGLIIAYLGVTVTITGGNWRVFSTASYNMGDIMLLVSTLCFGIYNVLIKRWTIPVPGMVKMFYLFFYGSLAFLPWVAADMARLPSLCLVGKVPTLVSYSAILFMSVGGSVLAYLFFNQGIDEIGATKAASFINLVPFITVLLSVLVLKETAGWLKWLGAVIIITGVFLSNHSALAKRHADTSTEP
ncbi:DMT family transporter [Martelella alba]|uniref:DMT family transporter n=1 Tax=Martelella alba TaxID=2590451 RepID=A0ABY2SII6_9HYPH|nr:DMT family transporter [Martelella alba]TKI04667.1 DMT family transporter [Martelella alba]